MTTLTEADVESAALDWLSDFGWAVAHGPDIAPDTPNAERDDYGRLSGAGVSDAGCLAVGVCVYGGGDGVSHE